MICRRKNLGWIQILSVLAISKIDTQERLSNTIPKKIYKIMIDIALLIVSEIVYEYSVQHMRFAYEHLKEHLQVYSQGEQQERISLTFSWVSFLAL